MQHRALVWLTTHEVPLKNEWLRRLREEPVVSGMAEPDILRHLMDETLAQFSELLQRRSVSRGAQAIMSREAIFALCHCGLNPLLGYFASGEMALVVVHAAHAPDGDLLAFLRARWALLAHREVTAFCSACVRRCETPLPQALSPLNSRRAGGSARGRRLALPRRCGGTPG